MIDRENWKAVRAYLQYRREVDLISSSSQRLEESWLRHLLEWADDVSFAQVPNIRPSFPQYILTARRVVYDHVSFSPVYVAHVIRCAHRFFKWLAKHKGGYSTITMAWLSTLKVPAMVIEHADHEAVTIEEVRAIASAPVSTMRDRRIRASAVFWFLSGIRVGAFVTLPLSAVDLDSLTVKQWPKLGVKTKFKKHATTFLLDIPDLLEVVKEWDKVVHEADSRFWFASVSPDTGLIDPKVETVGNHRNIRARKDLEDWLGRVGLPYHSPHKFRHGHAVYALKNAKDIPALKAVSQNLMHSNLSITDGVYGILSDMDVRSEIHNLGKGQKDDDVLRMVRELL